MEAKRFDTLMRAVASRTSRRSLIPLLSALPLGGTLGALLGLDQADAAKSGNCQPACGVCQTCLKGKCKKKRGKKKCKPGTCQPVANDTACNGTGKCLNGTCNPQPTCLPTAAGCDTGNPTACCSEFCAPIVPPAGICTPAVPGQECLANSDCATGSCIGYRCQ